ncbi:DUF1648 domain-containing protein [Paenisporosarcina cavernae]|uniref:DUF1648 domain-containing protein n=1 Tax=Paenisporosarcina cavernae TaxID=2320858 RepID=A0A385YWK4_9BACL|nr:DUF5808 domain-containing protein [Paenisporosarcina cavernae]AYC30660.1 DUF1648 domain-containing protein [Paenisporosarcina cavernae]
MAMWLFVIILIFTFTLQAIIPYYIRETEVFGIRIPEEYVHDERIVQLKKRYTLLLLLLEVVFIGAYLLANVILEWNEASQSFWGASSLFVGMVVSLGLYVIHHQKVRAWKQKENWASGRRVKKVIDTSFRHRLELIPSYFYVIPMIFSIAIGVLLLVKYDELPNSIPVHWGPTGEVDGFANKRIATVISLPVSLLFIQGLLWFFRLSLAKSGANLQVRAKKRSLEQQLAFRKFTSWLLLFISIAITVLLGYAQLSILYPDFGTAKGMMILSVLFVMGILGAVLIYTLKVGQSGSRYTTMEDEEVGDTSTDSLEDHHWKYGLFYVNKNDPSIVVEKRFGIGWTLNFGQPFAWGIVFVFIVFMIFIGFTTK